MSSGNKSFVLICTVISILALLIAGVNISRLFQIEKSSDINENSPQSEDVEEQFDVRNVSTTSIDVSPKTIDLSTVGGIIHLTNKDKEKILEDIETIKQIEQHEIEKIFDIES